MIRNVKRWREFEQQLAAAEKPDVAANFRLVDGMYELARKLGKFTEEDALDGLESTIRVARVINGVRPGP